MDSEIEPPSIPKIQALEPGREIGFYKVIEASPRRLLLRPDYTTGVVILGLGVVFLLLDIFLFGGSTRHFLRSLPDWFKGAMIALPPIGILWFFVMTGRSIVVDLELRVARKVLWFFAKQEVPLSEVSAVQLEVFPPASQASGLLVKLTMNAPEGRQLLELGCESASQHDFDSLPTSDFAALVALGRDVAGRLGVPLEMKGKMDEISALNLRMMENVIHAYHKTHPKVTN